MVNIKAFLKKLFSPKANLFIHINSKGVAYYLNVKEVPLRGGKPVPIYFFSRNFRPETSVSELPDKYIIKENPRNGFLAVVRRENNVRDGRCE